MLIFFCIFWIPSQIGVNIAELWEISGWGWPLATCSWGDGVSSCSCSCLSSSLPNCHTPLISKIFIFFMVFFPNKLFHPNVIDDSLIKFMSYSNMRCVIKQPYGRGISLSQYFIICCMIWWGQLIITLLFRHHNMKTSSWTNCEKLLPRRPNMCNEVVCHS